jgi:hypothetical protein
VKMTCRPRHRTETLALDFDDAQDVIATRIRGLISVGYFGQRRPSPTTM